MGLRGPPTGGGELGRDLENVPLGGWEEDGGTVELGRRAGLPGHAPTGGRRPRPLSGGRRGRRGAELSVLDPGPRVGAGRRGPRLSGEHGGRGRGGGRERLGSSPSPEAGTVLDLVSGLLTKRPL